MRNFKIAFTTFCLLALIAGFVYGSGGTVFPPATAAQIVAFFSGCSGTQYLGADGACHNASGGGAIIPNTTSALRGDGAGNGAAVTGTGSNCVHVDGTSAACGGGSSFSPIKVLHSTSLRSSGTVGALTLTDFASGNIAVVVLDGEGSTASEPTVSDSASTTYTKAGSGLIGGPHNITVYIGALAGAAPTLTPVWPSGSGFTGILVFELPVSQVQAVIDATGSTRSCCGTGNPATSVTTTTTVSDIVISAVGLNSSTDYALCPVGMTYAGRSLGQDASIACIGEFPTATTNLPTGFVLVTNGTNAAQTVALKHQ
jgi:hypothetical protein